MGDCHGRDQVITAEMALDENGNILAVRTHALDAVGAYTAAALIAGGASMACASPPGAYDIGAMHAMADAVFTNTSPMVPYRGAGRPEAAYLDRAPDRRGGAADRHRPHRAPPPQPDQARADALSDTRPGYVYDSGEFERRHGQGPGARRLEGLCRAQGAVRGGPGKLRGRGLAYFIEEAGIFNERMDLRFDPEGNVTILAGTHSHGQGHETAFAQMVSEWLGIPFESIQLRAGRHRTRSPFGRGTYASRSVMVGGCALKAAADDVIDKGRKMAAFLMEAKADDVDFTDGIFRVQGTNSRCRMQEVAKAFFRPMGIPMDLGVGLEGHGSYASEPGNFPNGCQVCGGGGRPRHRRGRGGALHAGRRPGPHHQPDDRGGPDPGRAGAGHRPGADRALRLRPHVGPARVGQLHGLRHAACRPTCPRSPR